MLEKKTIFTEPGRRFLTPAVQRAEVLRDDIAVIGVSGMYPGSPDLAAFWENLKNGKDLVSEIPEDRWNLYDYQQETNRKKDGKSYGKWGGFIDDVDKFDPLFFNISPKEALYMDPQERLYLQTVWSAIEDSGYVPEQLAPSGILTERVFVPSSTLAVMVNMLSSGLVPVKVTTPYLAFVLPLGANSARSHESFSR